MNSEQVEAVQGLVRYVIANLKKGGQLKGYDFDDEDLISVGLLAAVKTFKRWNPEQGALSTFLVPRIRGAILDYVNTEVSHGMGGKTARVCVLSLDSPETTNPESSGETNSSDATDVEVGTFVDSATYGNSIFGATPSGYRCPEQELSSDDLRDVVGELEPECYHLVTRHYGLDGNEPMSLLAMEKAGYGLVTTNYKRLHRCLSVTRLAFYGDNKIV